MGSFNATCIVSNLPIEAGDKVRYLALARSAFHQDGNDHICYVGGRWQVHGVPIKAEYNDYGSVKEIEESFTTKVFFAALDLNAVEKGVGDNQSHDVPVRKGMTQKDWLSALWEGRVYVVDHRLRRRKVDGPTPEYEPAQGMPSLRRIEKVLGDAGHAVVTGYGAEGFVLDEVSAGYIRARFGRHLKDSVELEKALPALHAAGYAAMVTAGTGSYANYSEILVAPLPPTDPKVFIHTSGMAPDRHTETHKPRPVSLAMIREDVWEILRATPIKSWDKIFTNEDLRKMALDAVEDELAFRAKKATTDPQLWATELSIRVLDLGDRSDTFQYYLGGHEGTSGLTFKAAWYLALELFEDVEDLKAYAQDLADMVYVQWGYSAMHGQWHPTTNSGQEGRWDEHRAFLLKLAAIKGRWEDDEDEDESV